MMNNRRVFLTFFLLCIAVLLPAQGSGDRGSEEAVVVQATGIVRLVGNANFPQIVISGSGMNWYIAREEMNKLYDLQHRTVTVEGEETVTELIFANGRSSGRIRRELRNIRIISIEEYTGP
jgi:hypothetical protein